MCIRSERMYDLQEGEKRKFHHKPTPVLHSTSQSESLILITREDESRNAAAIDARLAKFRANESISELLLLVLADEGKRNRLEDLVGALFNDIRINRVGSHEVVDVNMLLLTKAARTAKSLSTSCIIRLLTAGSNGQVRSDEDNVVCHCQIAIMTFSKIVYCWREDL